MAVAPTYEFDPVDKESIIRSLIKVEMNTVHGATYDMTSVVVDAKWGKASGGVVKTEEPVTLNPTIDGTITIYDGVGTVLHSIHAADGDEVEINPEITFDMPTGTFSIDSVVYWTSDEEDTPETKAEQHTVDAIPGTAGELASWTAHQATLPYEARPRLVFVSFELIHDDGNIAALYTGELVAARPYKFADVPNDRIHVEFRTSNGDQTTCVLDSDHEMDVRIMGGA